MESFSTRGRWTAGRSVSRRAGARVVHGVQYNSFKETCGVADYGGDISVPVDSLPVNPATNGLIGSSNDAAGNELSCGTKWCRVHGTSDVRDLGCPEMDDGSKARQRQRAKRLDECTWHFSTFLRLVVRHQPKNIGKRSLQRIRT